jgi:hypothetical protein
MTNSLDDPAVALGLNIRDDDTIAWLSFLAYPA